ncbi:lysophospholipase L1-like esterase [Chryseobacterium defluvii]|uniref:Lysophospholipase L1-like esterase n=1 Tax=Chryseobacterium defluvii TaxID=160396 RepID=A0A840KK81_9FLAO|nr:SGNH/GDSL hydrolase family protein [Chryseobacterium defluvii]MBB4808074.1 lysophospholipase L1-like esterase [Chryseobacterium defluvii]
MKKKIFIVLIIILGLVGFKYFYDKYSYVDQKEYFSIGFSKKENLKIGIIGDSWVVRQRLDSLLEQKLLDRKIVAEVFASGNPGAKTKLIYENLFKEGNEDFSSKSIIERQPDYCIIIAGVNDAAMDLGPDFYSHHMMLIIKTLLHYNIKPVVVSLPEFGIEENFQKKNIISKLSNKTADVFLNGGEEFTINDYRAALLKDLYDNKLDNKIILLNFDTVCRDYSNNKNLYSDPLHLNKEGYQKFSEFLAENLRNIK